MARTKRSRRSYSVGEWSRNRGTGLSKTGLFQIEWREDGRRLSRSLKHRDWARAKKQADEFAAGYVGPESCKAERKPSPSRSPILAHPSARLPSSATARREVVPILWTAGQRC